MKKDTKPATTEPDTRTERERFEDFTRRLIRVPKKEIDQKHAEYLRKKQTRQRNGSS
jgi:hypothetical protein